MQVALAIAIPEITSGGAVPLVAGPLQDTFQTTSTAMNGLAITPYGGGNWVQDSGTVGVTSNPQVPSVGVLKINSGGGVTQDAIWLVPAAPTAARWSTAWLNPTYALSGSARPDGFNLLANSLVISAHSSYANTYLQFSPAGNGLGDLFLNHALSGTIAGSAAVNDAFPIASYGTGTSKQAHWIGVFPGDTLQLRKKTAGSVVTYDVYLNGFLVGSNTVDIAAAYTGASLALNDSWGVKGDSQSTTANLLSAIETGDPTAAGMLTVKYLGHTAQKKWWDGSNDTYVRLKGDYSLQAPTSLWYTVINASSGAVAVAATQFTPTTTAMVNSIGTWSAAITIPAGSTPSTFYVLVERRDILSSAKAFARTPVLGVGEIIGGMGQSLMTQWWQSSPSGITVTPPANAWIADGSTDQNTLGPNLAIDFRVVIATAATSPFANSTGAPTYALMKLAAASGGTAFTFIRGGMGGTLQSERQPGAGHNIYERFQDGIDRAGDIGTLIFNGGTYEINGATSIFSNAQGTFTYGTDTVTYKGLIDTLVQTIEAYVGHPIRVLIAPPPGIDNTNTAALNQRAMNLARAHWELVQTNGGFGAVTGQNPQRYYQLAYTYDVQHIVSDQYHLQGTADGYGEMGRRYGYSLAKLLGGAANDRVGPSIDDTQQPVRSGNTIKVFFNLNGATTMALTGFAFASDGRGGMQFWTDNTFTTELLCTTTPSIGTPSGGKVDVTWTLTSTPGGPVVVRGPWSLAPFNRAQNATIQGAMMTDASVLRGTFSDTETTFYNPPVQPYFNGAFLADNTHDYLTST